MVSQDESSVVVGSETEKSRWSFR